jgi:class 3 adenylate cyclase
MAEAATRTVVCSVVFLDIIAYSKRSDAGQQKLKQTFNEMLARALEGVPSRDVIVLDTGDGAAIAFLGNPEDALAVAIGVRSNVASLPPGSLPARMGINLGPVKLVWDINGQLNILGDGINVAQRVMNFAQPGQLLASRSYYEMVSRLSKDYAALFTLVGTRTDKHVREHEVYAVAEGAGFATRAAESPQAQAARRQGADATLELFESEGARATPEPAAERPAKVFDAGANLIVSGSSRSSVQEALAKLALEGAQVVSQINHIGDKWVASCTHPKVPVGACKVEQLGLMRVVTGPTRESVDDKVRELLQFGAKLVSEAECTDGVWTAVCDTGGR